MIINELWIITVIPPPIETLRKEVVLARNITLREIESIVWPSWWGPEKIRAAKELDEKTAKKLYDELILRVNKKWSINRQEIDTLNALEKAIPKENFSWNTIKINHEHWIYLSDWSFSTGYSNIKNLK